MQSNAQSGIINKENVPLKYTEEEHKAAILRYKSGEAYQINAKMREGMELDEHEQEFVDTLDESLSQLPVYEGTVYRNVTFDDFGGQEAYDNFLAQHTQDKLVIYEQFLSSSKVQDGYPVEGKFKVQFIIEGKNGRDLDGYGNNMESEVLFPSNSAFIVNDINLDGEFPIISLQEVLINGYSTDEKQGNAVRNMQELHSENDNLQGIPEGNTLGNINGQVRPQSAASAGPGNNVRTGGRQGTLLSAQSKEQVNANNQADSEESAFSMPEGRELFTEEEQSGAQERVKGVAKLLDSDLKVLFVDRTSPQLKGSNGKFVRQTNTLFIAKDASTAEMYVEVFKHEFIHRLETKRWYQSFKRYLLNKSSAFEKYVRVKLKDINGTKFKGSREEAIKALTDYYFKEYTTDEGIAEYIRNSFTMEEAQGEIVADFAGDVLFKGKKYKKDMAFALAEEDLLPAGDIDSSIDALEELARTDRNLFQKVWDTIKDLINALMGRPQTKNITADLEYIENRLKQVYDSADTKKAAKKAGEEQYSKEKPFEKQVDDVLNGEHNPRLDLYVSETPQIFVELGFSNTPLLMRNSKVNEILEKHPEMSVDIIKQIPEAIRQPILILKSKTHSSESVVAVTDIETSKGNMIVPVWVNQEGNYIDFNIEEEISDNTNFVASAYGRNIKSLLEYANENEGFLYQTEDIEKVKQLLARNGLQLPTPLKLSDSDIIVPSKVQSVKNNISTESENYSENEEFTSENGLEDEGQRSIISPMQKAKDNFAKYERGEMTSEEYQESLDEVWGEANEEYGSFPTGEKAENAIAVPQAVSDDRNTRRHIRTILETGKLTEEMIEDVEEAVLLGDTMSYEVISDEKAIKKAKNAIADGTAEYQWIVAVETRAISKMDIAVGEQLLLKAVEAGDKLRVLELSSELADALTRAGQTVQASRLLKQMSGVGRLMSAQRTVKTLNRSLQEKYGDDALVLNI